MDDLIINNLAAFLVITAFLVVITRNIKNAACIYGLQSLVLVSLFFTIAHHYDAHELYDWSVVAFILKVILLPGLLFIKLGPLVDKTAEQSLLRPVWIAILVMIITLVCMDVVAPVALPMVASLKWVLAVSLAHFFIGLLCIITQRNILKQIFGYCLMENGSSLMLALLAYRAPHLLEIGITIDALFAVIVMVILARLIYRKLQTLDVNQLTVLKG